MVSGTSEESASYSVGPQWASVGVLNGSQFFQNARETVDQPPKCRRDHYAIRVPVVNPECGDSIPTSALTFRQTLRESWTPFSPPLVSYR